MLTNVFADRAPGSLGVAVSGGSDSTALLHLANTWGRANGVRIEAATVDHGLRAEAAVEAQAVAALCSELGVRHEILPWRGWDGAGNIQDQARRARYGLIADWADRRGIAAVALGHTADDQAETFLMRLARGTGVDGLSGMGLSRMSRGIEWLRPLLAVRRRALRDYLTEQGLSWVEDPSNEDEAYQRVRVRKALAVLEGLGIGAPQIVATSARLRSARNALEQETRRLAQEVTRLEDGDLLFERARFNECLPEIRARLLTEALCWVASAPYGPRRESLMGAEDKQRQGTSSTLHGCRILVGACEFRVTREWRAVQDCVGPTNALWDQRWSVSGPDIKGLEVRPLGESGLRLCPDWRATGRPSASLVATPAVWHVRTLLAAPLAGMAGDWTASLISRPFR